MRPVFSNFWTIMQILGPVWVDLLSLSESRIISMKLPSSLFGTPKNTSSRILIWNRIWKKLSGYFRSGMGSYLFRSYKE